MNQLPISPGMIIDLLLFLLGFGFIVFIHELGHFLAARWAGIRVLAFAVGFGPAMFSYRRGLGFRNGSSEPEYRKRLESAPADAASFSPTEYRLNWLPFGGYVKMLGQDDLHPDSVSAAPDSYQSVRPWKRMVVISAGVVMNIILSGILFIIVFLAGLKTEPPIIGRVLPGTPAATAVALNAREMGVTSPGLLPGDRVAEVDGEMPRDFSEVVLATTMAAKGEAVSMVVRREGVDETLRFLITPETSRTSGLLEIGVEPPRSTNLIDARTDKQRQDLSALFVRAGLVGVEPGMMLVGTADGTPIKTYAEADRVFRNSEGRDVNLEFAGVDENAKATNPVRLRVSPRAAMQVGFAHAGASVTPVEHLLGLTPVMTVQDADSPDSARGFEQGLRTGDIFARVGSVEFPSIAQGMMEIRAHKGKQIPMTVLRREAGSLRSVALSPKVNSKGTIGFLVGDTRDQAAVVSRPMRDLSPKPTADADPESAPSSAVRTFTVPGTQITMVNGSPVSSFSELRERLKAATRRALETNAESEKVTLAVTYPSSDSTDNELAQNLTWDISRADIKALHALGWENPLPSGLFEPTEFVLKATSPVEAIKFGVARTHAVMMNTYLTFLRLFQQTVKIEHLKGPVGIAHLGTLIAERGTIWMLFFLALISVNLAVVNFLPLPIVDGGQFLLLVIEQLRGRPAPMALQNGLTLAGLVLIGSLFLIVTFNDIKNLLGL